MAAMTTTVDVLYRGVPLAEQVSLAPLSQVQALLAHAAPMPVGTPLTMRAADQVAIRVVVVAVRETHGEADAAASGMILGPSSDASAGELASWGKLVAGAPEAPPVVARGTTDQLAAGQIAEATATAAGVARSTALEAGAEPKRRTRELSSQELAAVAQAAGTVTEPIRPVRASKPPEIRRAEEAAAAAMGAAVDGLVDDGKATTVMEAVSPELLAQLGLSGSEAGVSGAMAAVPEAQGSEGDASSSSSMSMAAADDKSGAAKPKKKSKKR